MARRPVRTTLLAGLVAALVVAVVRALRRPDLHSTLQAAASREAADASGRPATQPAPGPDAPVIATGAGLVEPDDGEPAIVIDPTEVEAPWIPPVGGGCPEGYAVKAKVSSRIFHVPGGLAYERTRPDRCYRSPADAEVDGFRAAKR